MAFIAEIVTLGAQRTRAHAEKLLVGITPGMFARQPVIGGRKIETNHPAFVFGHLSLYPPRLLQLFECDSAAVDLPAKWSDLFQRGAACVDDAAGTHYPPLAELTAAYVRGYDAAIAAIAQAPDSAFTRPMPDERYRSMLPTVGAAAFFMLNNHVMFHLGQVSAWRRCMGLGPAE